MILSDSSGVLNNTNINVKQILNGNYQKPERYWTVIGKNREKFNQKVIEGKEIASSKNLNVVCLARNCEKQLLNSIHLIERLSKYFLKTNVFVYENDSTDRTKRILSIFKKKFHISLNNHNRPYLTGVEVERTQSLAEYRNHCIDWVKNYHPSNDYTMVLDLDADGGFYIDGVLNSVGWLESLSDAGGMGSYSLCFGLYNHTIKIKHYDRFAVRLKKWEETDVYWFNDWLPQTGGDPIAMKSCFGGLAIYKNKAFLSGRYEGSTCEHIGFHKSLEENGWKMYFNPGSLFGSVIEISGKNNINYRKLCIKN